MARISTKEYGEQKRREILEMIICYIENHGYPPTYREIREEVGLESNSSVNRHICRMLEDGTLETDADIPGSPRAIRVPGYKFVKVDDNERVLQPQCGF